MFIIDASDATQKLRFAKRMGDNAAESGLFDMIDFAEQITWPLIPIKWGYLQDSFYWSEKSGYDDDLLVVEYFYSSENPNDGFDYAWYQERGIDWRTGKKLHHPSRRGKHPVSPYAATGLGLASPFFEEIVGRSLRVVY